MKLKELEPHSVKIVGIDCQADTAELEELLDGERDHTPGTGLIGSIAIHGVQQAIECVQIGKQLYVKDGRRRTLAARAAKVLTIPILVKDSANALLVEVSNTYRQDDPPWVKAAKAERLRGQGYKADAICAALEVDGKPCSKMTLTNWKRLLNVKAEILDYIKAGTIPVTAGYEIGKVKPEEQDAALAAWQAAGKALAGPADFPDPNETEEGSEDDGEGKPRGPRGARTKKFNASRLQEFYAYLTPGEDDEPNNDCDIACAVIAAITGQDPTGEGLKPWKEVHRAFKRALQ